MSSLSFYNRYSENDCRLCAKSFCCPKCRAKHEKDFHGIFPECTICVYGKMSCSKPSQELMEHIKEAHWPLHCVYCKKIFDSDDFNEHSKCPIGRGKLDLVAKTPLASNILMECYDNAQNIESPPVCFAGFLLVAFTSTPRDSDQRALQNIDKFERKTKIKNANENLSSQTPSVYNENRRAEKRRVTFSQTPMVDNPKKSEQFLKASLKKFDMFQDDSSNRFNVTVDAEQSFNKYESAQSKIETEVEGSKRRSSGNNDTLWESALNISSDLIENDIPPPKGQLVDSGSAIYDRDDSPVKESQGLWSSMTSMMKSMVQGIAGNATERRKRHLSDSDCISELEIKQLKKIKLTDIKCRPPIRNYRLLQHPVAKVGRGTQTD